MANYNSLLGNVKHSKITAVDRFYILSSAFFEMFNFLTSYIKINSKFDFYNLLVPVSFLLIVLLNGRIYRLIGCLAFICNYFLLNYSNFILVNYTISIILIVRSGIIFYYKKNHWLNIVSAIIMAVVFLILQLNFLFNQKQLIWKGSVYLPYYALIFNFLLVLNLILINAKSGRSTHF